VKLVLVATALALLSGCAHMRVPAELKSNEIPVDETPGLFSGNLRFGPFKAAAIDKGWTRGSSWTFGVAGVAFGKDALHQDYSFRFEEQGQTPRDVACRAAYRGSHLEIGRNLRGTEGQQTLECKFAPKDATAPEGILRLGFEQGPGRLEFGETVLELHPNHSFEGKSFEASDALGYVIHLKGEPVAAIDRNKTGAWMKPELDAKVRSAAALAASILYVYRPQEPDRK
jgi:hypothetical protein